MPTYVYDLEVFPNFFSATFVDCKTDEPFQYLVYKGRDQRRELVAFLHTCSMLIGFNSLSYDDPMLRVFLRNSDNPNLNNILFEMSKRLINDDSREDVELRALRYGDGLPWRQMDLMKIMAFDALGVSLKQVAINLRWYRIQDLPLPYDHYVQPNEIDTVLDYNLNDVLITQELYKSIQPQIKLREDISQIYKADVTNASDSKIANVVLEKIYVEETNNDIKDIRHLRTKHESVRLADCIAEDIEFRTPLLKELHNKLRSITVYQSAGFAYSNSILFNGIRYELGIGGLHSKDGPAKFFSTKEYAIRDADVGSYYPSIMINNGIKPSHLGDDFVRILKRITAERLAAKKSGDTVKADALKITVNSIFGKLNSDTFWLEDAKAMLSVTVSGQLYLLMLIEALAEEGIPNISANTDGIVGQVFRDKESTYKDVCDWWQKKTRFELEFTDYEAYIRSDVNNYITKKSDGKTKEKGRYSKEVNLKKGYKYPIVPRCLYEYFINGKPIEQTLGECKDILDFCISQKAGKQYKMELWSSNGNNLTGLQKNNRFYITRRGDLLIKRNLSKDSISRLYVGNLVRILNDYDKTVPFESYDVDLSFYRKEVEKIIHEIEPPFEQIGLFSSVDAVNLDEATSGDEEDDDHEEEEMSGSTNGFHSTEVPMDHVLSSTPIKENEELVEEDEDALYKEYYDSLEFACSACPYCESSNIMIMEKWGVCGMCDQSWDISELYYTS